MGVRMRSSIGRAPARQAGGNGIETRRVRGPLEDRKLTWFSTRRRRDRHPQGLRNNRAGVAQRWSTRSVSERLGFDSLLRLGSLAERRGRRLLPSWSGFDSLATHR